MHVALTVATETSPAWSPMPARWSRSWKRYTARRRPIP